LTPFFKGRGGAPPGDAKLDTNEQKNRAQVDDLPTIGVCLVTWPRSRERLTYFKRTVGSFLAHRRASAHEIRLFCSAESECPEELGANLVAYCNMVRIPLSWRKGRANVGANMNAALKMGSGCDFVILLQDDWVMVEPVDFSVYADFLQQNSAFAMVRFSWAEIPDGDERSHWIVKGPDVTWKGPDGAPPIRWLDPRSTYFYGDQPHMRRGTFERELGLFKEGGDLGEPEVELNGRLKLAKWQIGLSHKVLFHHIGEVSSVDHAGRFGNSSKREQ
jgi:hypothetical protein